MRLKTLTTGLIPSRRLCDANSQARKIFRYGPFSCFHHGSTWGFEVNPLTTALAEIKERADEATEGPWQQNVSTVREGMLWIPEWDGRLYMRADIGTNVKNYKMAANCEFIAHARQDIPALLRVIEKLIEQRDELIPEQGMDEGVNWPSVIKKELDTELLALLTQAAEVE